MDFTSEIITQLLQFLKFIFLIKRIACVHGLWYTGTGKYTQQGGICMDFKDLEYFAAIARCGNITRAAQQLYVSQPTLSKFLQKLEGDTGLVLFQRAGRRLELTYAGQRYLAHAERLLSQKREMDAELTDLLRADTGVLHVGMPPFRCSFSLPEVLPVFRAQFPQVQFRIEEAPSAELDHKLLEGEIDLAFYMSFARHPGLSYRVLRRDRMYAVFGKEHPLEQAAAREPAAGRGWETVRVLAARLRLLLSSHSCVQATVTMTATVLTAQAVNTACQDCERMSIALTMPTPAGRKKSPMLSVRNRATGLTVSGLTTLPQSAANSSIMPMTLPGMSRPVSSAMHSPKA